MTTQYTPTLKLALPVTGELSGTWGDTVNDNITSMIEQAIAGLSTINTWTGNAHTLTTANGTTSESRCAMLVAATGGGSPTAAAEIICPAAAKLYVLQNNTAFAVTLKTSAGTGVAVAAGNTAFLFCDGTNVNACVTTIIDGRVTGNLTVDGNATINGNTTLGNATTDTITATARFNTDLVPSTDNARDLGSVANSWKDLYIDGTATMALVAISGGTINGVSIGATTAATLINVDNLRLDGNTISSTDTNGNVVIAPNGTGDVQLDADTVRVGDANATATVTSNGSGSLVVTTGGAGTTTVTTGGIGGLTLSTNSGTNSGVIQIAGGVDGDITLTPNGTGDIIMSADRTQFGDANTDTTLTTNGTGSLNLTTNNGSNSGTIQLAQGINGNITLTPNGTGSVSVPKLVWSNGTATRVPYLTTGGQFTDSANLTFNGTDLTVSGAVNAGTINATTLDLTNLEVTNIKAKDGTAGMQIADSTGVVSFTANPVMSGGTANGVAYLNGSKALTTGSALTFNGSDFGVSATIATATLASSGAYSALSFTNSGGAAASGTILTNSSGILQSRAATHAYTNADASSEYMRLTSTGLGIGTSSPTSKLTVAGAISVNTGAANLNALGLLSGSSGNRIGLSLGRTAQEAYIGIASTSNSIINGDVAGDLDILTTTGNIRFSTNAGASLQATLDTSGNLGLGVTPSAWGSPYTGSFQMKEGGFLANNQINDVHFGVNAFYNGTNWRYIGSNSASRYEQFNGGHFWLTAPSGTAGNAISFTQAMTLDASGNFLLGTTTARNRLTVNGNVFSVPTLGTASGQAFFGEAAGYGTMIGTSGFGYGWIQQQRVDGTATAYDLFLQPVGGYVGIGTGSTNPIAKLTVAGTAGNNNSLMSIEGADFVRMYADATFGSAINWSTGDVLRFATSDSSFGSFTERARFTTAGAFVVGGSTPVNGGVITATNSSGTMGMSAYAGANNTTINTLPINAGSGGGMCVIAGIDFQSGASFSRMYLVAIRVSGGTSSATALIGSAGTGTASFAWAESGGFLTLTASGFSGFGGYWNAMFINN